MLTASSGVLYKLWIYYGSLKTPHLYSCSNREGVPLTGLTPPHFCVFPRSWTGFRDVFIFNGLRLFCWNCGPSLFKLSFHNVFKCGNRGKVLKSYTVRIILNSLVCSLTPFYIITGSNAGQWTAFSACPPDTLWWCVFCTSCLHSILLNICTQIKYVQFIF